MTNDIRIPKEEFEALGFEMAQILGGVIRKPISALLGNPSTGELYADAEETQIYVHDDGSTISGVSTISASGMQAYKAYIRPNQPVKIILNDYGVYEFDKIDSQADQFYSAGSTEKHTQDPVHLNQIGWGTIHPYSGLQVMVKGATYSDIRVNDLIADAFDGTAQDTSMASITPPTTNNRQIGVLVQMDANNGALEYKQSSEYSAAINRDNALANSLLPTKDANRFRVGYVFLRAGASAITYDDIWNLPEWIGSTAGNPPFDDDGALLQDSADTSKKLIVNVGNISASTTRTWNIQDSNDTFVGRATTDTLTNKTFDAQGTGNVLTNVGADEIEQGIIFDLTSTASATPNADYVMVSITGTGLRRMLIQNLLGLSSASFGTEDLGDIGGTSTTSTTGVDVNNSDFAVDIGNNGEIQCTYHVLAVAGNTGTFLELRLVAGAVSGAWHPIVFAATGGVSYVSFTDTLSGVSSGSQTVKLQVRSSSGSSVTIDTAQGFANDVLASWITR